MQKITPFLWFDGKAGRVMHAMMQMTKIEIAGLQSACDQR
jgi:predicted 3-demethylubiquinone-9 3-methyltransferase (glyoxalase superfamily)